jgi:hypothetical protein
MDWKSVDRRSQVNDVGSLNQPMKFFLVFVALSLMVVVTASAQNTPKAVANPDPVYPSEAAELGFGGTVKVTVKVDKKDEAKVLQAFGPNAPCANLGDGRIKKIRKAATDAASQVKFEPLTKDGKPSEFELMLSYSFDATGKPSKTNEIIGTKGRIVDAGTFRVGPSLWVAPIILQVPVQIVFPARSRSASL